MDQQGVVFDIKKYSLHDGPGIRTTVFLKGCPLSCWWCHNPESQNLVPDRIAAAGFKRDYYSAGSDGKPRLGRTMSSAEVMDQIQKDVLFYDESGGGVTFSGGEPLMQPGFLIDLLQACRHHELHTIVDTCGYVESDILLRTAALTDLFFYDLKIINDQDHIHYTGVSNKLILGNLKLLASEGYSVQIRLPIIPGITDTEQNLLDIADFLLKIRQEWQLSLLPYNHFGDNKYKRLALKNPMPRIDSPSKNVMERVETFFIDKGFDIQIGG